MRIFELSKLQKPSLIKGLMASPSQVQIPGEQAAQMPITEYKPSSFVPSPLKEIAGVGTIDYNDPIQAKQAILQAAMGMTGSIKPIGKLGKIGLEAEKGLAPKLAESKAGEETYYHGTNKQFNNFDIEHRTTGSLGTGFNFTNNLKDAQQYGKIIKEATLDIKNPLDISGGIDSKTAKILSDKFGYEIKAGDNGQDVMRLLNLKVKTKIDSDNMVNTLKSVGYDGIMIKSPSGGKTIKLAFDPEQIIMKNSSKVNPLESEALKYKSADEFVKNTQNKILTDASPWDADRKYKFYDYHIETRKISSLNQSYQLQKYEFKNVNQYATDIRKGDKFPLITIKPNGDIVNGNFRYEAYKKLNVKEIPVLVADKMNKYTDPRITNLSDIWNAAHKGKVFNKPVVETPSAKTENFEQKMIRAKK